MPYIQTNIKNYTLCNDGDVIFADASEDTKDICKPVEFIKISNKNVVSGLHTIHARDFQNITVLGFKGYLFSSYNFHKQVHRLTQGTKIFSINASNFREMYVGIPDKAEQQEIVSLLGKIDDRITTQSKIIDNLMYLIKRISHHFIDNLKTNEVLLSNIADIYQPTTISQSECVENGLYNVYGANGIIGKYNKFNHEKEQVCITCRGSTSGNVFLSSNHCWITGNAMVINIDNNLKIVNKTYLFHYLSSLNFRNIVSGSGQPQIVREPLMKIKIKLPNIELQDRFEEIISSFSNKLQKEKDILLLFKKQKAYLLQNMFI